MIARITGKLISKHPPQLLVDVMGVGYELEAPMSTFYRLPATGETVSLLTHLTIREDAHLLFGFATQAEKDLFRDLIKISGIGPKSALSILSGVNVDDFWAMVRAGDTARLIKLPGIGKKTAERLVIEMRDKAGAAEFVGQPGASAISVAGPLQEARAALNALGYKPAEIQRFTEAVYKDGMTTEQIIQEALKRAVR
jgi:Holliday junction DNA helicase RuvA